MKSQNYYPFIIAIGGLFAGYCYTKTQNLGQKSHGNFKYKSKNKDGYNTGCGQAFEDLTVICLKQMGKTVTRHKEYKNGPDLTVDGKDFQLKCGTNGFKSAKSYYDDGVNGSYRYEGQDAMIPKGQKKESEWLFKNRKNNHRGGPNNVVESPVTRKEAETHYKRGWGSYKMDLQDRNLATIAVVVAGIVVISGVCIELYKEKEEKTFKNIAKKTGKWLSIGLLTGVGTLVVTCAGRQLLRP